MITLSDELRAALQTVESACLIAEVNYETAVIVKVEGRDAEGFRGAPIKYWYELGPMEAGPVLCLAVEVLDDPTQPFFMETLLNVASEYDLLLARKLQAQRTLTLHFFDENLEYHFSKCIQHRDQQRRELSQLVEMALEYLATMSEPDWKRARQQFFVIRPRKV
jgi:hypothetical protein